MGSYIYKPTLADVELANGELATIYVYSHKAGWDTDKVEAACDHWFAKNADLVSKWAVTGFKGKDGKIEVDVDYPAKKIGARAMVNDDWFADADRFDTSLPVYAAGKVALVRTVKEPDPADPKSGYYLDQRLIRNVWTTVKRRPYRAF